MLAANWAVEGRCGLRCGSVRGRGCGSLGVDGLWVVGLWGEVALRTAGESGFGGFVGLMWAMVSAAFGRSETLVN